MKGPHMTDPAVLQPGDPVTYRDINLAEYVGTFEAYGGSRGGGECWVQWHRPNAVRRAECLVNLRRLPAAQGRKRGTQIPHVKNKETPHAC
jgi:hypothetical protein